MEVQDVGDWIDEAPWRDQKVTLLWIGPGGAATQAWSLSQKREILPRPGGTYYAVWTGQFHSEVRRIPDDQVMAVLERIR